MKDGSWWFWTLFGVIGIAIGLILFAYFFHAYIENEDKQRRDKNR
jgi:hypothetical protein